MPKVKKGDERVTMKITGVLVDILVQLDLELYGPFVVYYNNKKVLYVQVLRAIYGMLIASMLWYNKFRADLEKIGFIFNLYELCVTNKDVKGKKHTIRFYMDDLMISHEDPKVNDDFEQWLQT